MLHPIQTKIRFICVDDNLLDTIALETLAKDFVAIEQIGSYSNVNDAHEAICKLKPDVVFFDIDMPGQNGIDLLRQLREKVPIAVFITSHPEFAIDGFELSALDYIVKPLTHERFALTVERIEEFWEMKQKAIAYEVFIEHNTLTFKEGYTHIKLPETDVIYLEAMQDYTKVVTKSKSYLTLTTLSGFLEKLSEEKFIRVHRSYAVAKNKITQLTTSQLQCGQFIIPIGKTYRNKLTENDLRN